MTKELINKNRSLMRFVLCTALFMDSVQALAEFKPAAESARIKIEYLLPTFLNINAEGINRLNFGSSRIIRIVGDNSRYEAFLSDNGSDLFLISKVPAGETINLSVLTAKIEAIDLSIYVSKSHTTPVYANINLAGENSDRRTEKEEISKMIRQMYEGTAGKYYVIEQKRTIKIPTESFAATSLNSKSQLLLNQYVTYRYGNLVGAGFNLTGIDQKQALQISKEQLSSLFKNVLAVSIDNQNLKPEGRSKSNKRVKIPVFIVFSKEEGSDV